MLVAGLRADVLDLKRAIFSTLSALLAESALAQFPKIGLLPRPCNSLLQLHDRLVEQEISRHLYLIAALLRVSDDQLNRLLLHTIPGGFVEYQGEEPEPSLNLRFACNKILHAKTVRWVPVRGSSHQDGVFTVMSGYSRLPLLEVQGNRASNNWNATINLFSFLEGATVAVFSIETVKQASDNYNP